LIALSTFGDEKGMIGYHGAPTSPHGLRHLKIIIITLPNNKEIDKALGGNKTDHAVARLWGKKTQMPVGGETGTSEFVGRGSNPVM
jgi:hypothetical protein